MGHSEIQRLNHSAIPCIRLIHFGIRYKRILDVLPYTYITKLFLYILIHSYTSLYIRQNGCIRLIHPFCQTKKYILTCLGAPFNIQTFPFFLQISNFLSQSFSFWQIWWNTFHLKLLKTFPQKIIKFWNLSP